MRTRHIHYGFVAVIGAILALLLGMTLYHLYRQMRTASDVVLVQHLVDIENALRRIDETCEIVSIMHERSHIDFLVVSKFVGSQIGPLNLRFPEKWAGPYVDQNPTVHGKQFELVKMQDGYAIVPGIGVRLANGKVIGKDIIFGPERSIDELLKPDAGCTLGGKPCVCRVVLKHLTATMPEIIKQHELVD